MKKIIIFAFVILGFSLTFVASAFTTSTFYLNKNRQPVLRPSYSVVAPTDATARCRDFTYSFSRTRRGTCSYHGGVSVWYK